jgi:hypothetical protein
MPAVEGLNTGFAIQPPNKHVPAVVIPGPKNCPHFGFGFKVTSGSDTQ